MKNLTPNGIALRVSFLVALTLTILVFLLEYFNTSITIAVIAVFPVSFLASYIGFRIAIEKFIYRKIKVIYKTIHNLKLASGEQAIEFDMNTDVLQGVKKEVTNIKENHLAHMHQDIDKLGAKVDKLLFWMMSGMLTIIVTIVGLVIWTQ